MRNTVIEISPGDRRSFNWPLDKGGNLRLKNKTRNEVLKLLILVNFCEHRFTLRVEKSPKALLFYSYVKTFLTNEVRASA